MSLKCAAVIFYLAFINANGIYAAPNRLLEEHKFLEESTKHDVFTQDERHKIVKVLRDFEHIEQVKQDKNLNDQHIDHNLNIIFQNNYMIVLIKPENKTNVEDTPSSLSSLSSFSKHRMESENDLDNEVLQVEPNAKRLKRQTNEINEDDQDILPVQQNPEEEESFFTKVVRGIASFFKSIFKIFAA